MGLETDHDFETVLQLCKNLEVERFKKGEAIFKQGDFSNEKMYIVFLGEVHVLVKTRDFITRKNLEKIEQEKQ